jgi:Holliday junction DNA helicase RuvA
MIGFLRGRVIKAGVVETSGIGWLLLSPDALVVGQDVALHVTTLTRDGTISLYGFIDEQDQALFESLIKVPRVGPAVALAILRRFSPGEVVSIIRDGQVDTLSGVSGVGKKTAELICTTAQLPSDVAADPGAASLSHEVISSLVDLGFDVTAATQAVASVIEEQGEVSDEALLRGALSSLRTTK